MIKRKIGGVPVLFGCLVLICCCFQFQTESLRIDFNLIRIHRISAGFLQEHETQQLLVLTVNTKFEVYFKVKLLHIPLKLSVLQVELFLCGRK